MGFSQPARQQRGYHLDQSLSTADFVIGGWSGWPVLPCVRTGGGDRRRQLAGFGQVTCLSTAHLSEVQRVP